MRAMMAGQGTCGPKGGDHPHALRAAAAMHGPFRLILEDGTDVTPGSPLRQAILAVLIAAPQQARARKQVKELFWSGAAPDKASGSLRTALHALRKDLAGLGPDIIRADLSTISLRPDSISVVSLPGEDASFLEGMDLGLGGCEPFEEWLRDKRVAEAPTQGDHQRQQKSKGGTRPRSLAIGILPTLHGQLALDDLLIAEGFLDEAARTIAAHSRLHVHDLRGGEEAAVPLPVETGEGPTHLVQARLLKRGGVLWMSLQLQEAWTRRVLWISDRIDVLASDSEDFASSVAEALLYHLAGEAPDDHVPDLFPWTALTALFSLKDAAILRTGETVEEMIAQGHPEALKCLGHFSQIFRENEGVSPAPAVTSMDLCSILATVSRHDPLLPLWETLAGYSAHMLAGDNDLAETLLLSAYRRAPNLALNLDHLAVLRMSRGDIAGAQAALDQCLRVGINSPWKYTYQVTGAMISMAKGDYSGSLAHANRAINLKPRFIGALRYAMAGCALQNNARDAMRLRARIRDLRPDYDMGEWAESLLRRSSLEVGRAFANSVREHELA